MTINKRITAIVITAFTTSFYLSFTSVKKDKVHKIDISYILKTESNLNMPKLGFIINYLNNNVVYELPISYSKTITDKDYKVISDITENRYEYLVTEKKSAKGAFYKFSTEGEKEIYKFYSVDVDSVLSRYLNFVRKDSQGKPYTNFDVAKGYLLIRKNKKKGGVIEEVYVPKITSNNFISYKVPDSMYLYFSPKMNFVEYSLASSLDSSRQMKYIGCRVIYLQKENIVNAQKLEAILEMKEIAMDKNNKATLLKFIDRFRKGE